MAAKIDDETRRLFGMDPNAAMQNPGATGLGAWALGGNKLTGSSRIHVSTTGEPDPVTGNLFTEKMSYDEARRLPLKWLTEDPQKLKDLVNTGILRKASGFNVNMGMPEILSAWDELVKASWEMNKGGVKAPSGSEWTPWDVLNTYSNEGMKLGTVRRGDWEIDIATGEKVKYVGPKTKTRTEKRVDLSSYEDVRAIVNQTLTELLGRAPTAEELSRFRATINDVEERTPSFATVTEEYGEMGEVVSTSTKTEGGVSAAMRAGVVEEEAKKGPEYAKFQSGTTYWNALMQMLGG